MHTVIIGSGLAGITLARELRKLDKARPITVVTADDGAFYAKPNLSNAFAAGKDVSALVQATAGKLEADLSIRILTQAAIERIDAAARTLHGIAAAPLAYDQLVLAVGASPIPLPLAGDGAADALAVNSLDDYARLRRALPGKRRIAIVGAGLVGCEFANDLILGGFAVDLHDLAAHPVARLLPETAARRVRDSLGRIGVRLHLPSRLKEIRRADDGYALIDADGGVHPCDLVLSAIGLRPNLELARSAGLKTRAGIVVDAFLRTSQPNIYALGDCSEIAGHCLPYVMPIMHGAKKLAATLNGTPEPVRYPAMPVVLKTPACPTVVCPPPDDDGHWVEEAAVDGGRALFISRASGAPSGFILQGALTGERMALAARMPGLAVA